MAKNPSIIRNPTSPQKKKKRKGILLNIGKDNKYQKLDQILGCTVVHLRLLICSLLI